MKRISASNIVVTVIAVALLISISVVSAYAVANPIIEAVLSELINMCITPDQANAGEDELVEAMNYARKVWRTSLDVRSKVDYDVLTSVYSQLIVQGVPCEIVTSRGAAQGYYIKGTGDLPLCNGKGRYSIKGSYFSDTSGNIFYADLPDNGKTSSSVPSTSAPTASENTNTTYVRGPSSDLSLLTPSNELQALKYINQTSTHIANETHRIIELLGDTEKYVFRLYLNVGRFIDGMNSIISGVYRQADLLAGYLPRLDDTVNRLTDIRSASWASVDVENRILSSSTKIGSLLSSVIRNGQIQVNTSPLEARLDKLISMYSKVNSVVLDTASVNGGQITGAVGGELKDVVFWGDTSKVNNTFVSADGVAYTLNDTPVDINGLTLRSVNLGSTIPSYIANDPVLYAGVWRKGTDYIISDTYNASTGEYVQRIGRAAFDGLPLVWGLDTTSFPDNPYFVTSIDVSLIPGCPKGSFGSEIFVFHPLFSAGTWGNVVYGDNYIALGGNGSSSYLGVSASATLSTVEQLQSVLAGTEFYFIRYGTVLSASVTSSTIAIPEGSSYISSYNVRITGKYETYDSYTQTADIISGIGRTEALLSSINTAVQDIKSYTSSIKTTTSTISTNVGKVNTALTSVIKDGKLKVDNSDIVTALAKLDNLPGIKTAVEGINTALTSVIADGQVKVDNSAVVAALAKLPNIDTSVASIKSYTSSIKTTTSTISTNVGKVNTALTSVIKDGKFKVDNSDIVTALGKLDKLAELPTIKTAVDGVNTTISSAISQGKLKVDNSAVVAAIEGIQVGSAADLSPVVVRMDAILAELQSAPGSAACEHTYTQHTEQEATCTLPGLLIFTCSQCGDSYSEIVAPLGHDWIVTSHVDAVTDPETGEETASAYDVYTCSRCQRTYEDHDGSGPEEDYSSSSISKLVVKVFSRLGTFAGKLIGSVIHLFDKAITALDNVVSKFNEYVEQISGFGGGYPAWLTGFWGVLPAELQVALTFAVICMALGVVGKKLFFS